jgi:hypothetical protein
MESVLVCFVSISLMIVSMVTITMTTVHSASKLSDTWRASEERVNEIRRTAISSYSPDDYQGGLLELTVKNEGQVNITDFGRWDLLVEKPGANATYLTYSASYPPGVNQWAIKGFYITSNNPEVFDLNVLNPGERIIIGVNLLPGINEGETVRVTVSTADGVTSQSFATRQAP